MTILRDPFFWALLSMFALVGACRIVSDGERSRSPLTGLVIVVLFDLGRGVLALPFVHQPRFAMGGWHWLVGGLIFVAGLVFSFPALTIRPFTAPDEGVRLQTTGLYGAMRNPIYLGEILWCLGWSIMFRSVIGVALLPLWWAGLLFLIAIEEQSLARALGEPYLEYRRRVRGRMIPGLPI